MGFVFPTPQLQQVPNPLNIYYEVGEPSSPSLEPKIGSISVDSVNSVAYMLMSKNGNVPDWRALATSSDPGDIVQYAVLVGGEDDTILSITPVASTTKVLVSGGTGANPSWQDISGGALALGAFGSTPNASGASLSGSTLTLQPASGSFPGGVSTTTQTFAGVKTFSSAPILSSLTGVLTANGASAVSASTVTQNGVVYGGASNEIGSTSVGATGTILQGNTAAPPTYSTATYPSTTTANQILYSSSNNVVGQITASNNGVLITSNSGVPSLLGNGTAGYVLTANSSAPPSWQDISLLSLSINVQTFTSNGTYTPTSGMVYCKIEGVGGGGGGGGAAATDNSASQWTMGGGGSGAEYAVGYFSSGTIGASQSVVIGTGGSGGAAGVDGSDGVQSSVGALMTFRAGRGGKKSSIDDFMVLGGNPGPTGTGGYFRSLGTPGGAGNASLCVISVFGVLSIMGGVGGSSLLGNPGNVVLTTNQTIPVAPFATAGNAGNGYGSGGGGAISYSSTMASSAGAAGGAGIQGVVIVTEFIA